MDLRGPTRFRSSRSPMVGPQRTDRFLGDLLHAPPQQNPSPASSTAGDELSEDDIFSIGDFSDQNLHSHPSTPSSSSSSTPRRHHNRNGRPSLVSSESFGILSALPERETRSVFNHKASVPVSSSRDIPSIPRPPQDRLPPTISPYSATKYHQSAPVNVPLLPKAMIMRRSEFVEVDGGDDKDSEDGDGPMLPPHEIVARSLAKSQMVACSVLEGAGRTLKGRDLRQVRNAVFRQTGFID